MNANGTRLEGMPTPKSTPKSTKLVMKPQSCRTPSRRHLRSIDSLDDTCEISPALKGKDNKSDKRHTVERGTSLLDNLEKSADGLTFSDNNHGSSDTNGHGSLDRLLYATCQASPINVKIGYSRSIVTKQSNNTFDNVADWDNSTVAESVNTTASNDVMMILLPTTYQGHTSSTCNISSQNYNNNTNSFTSSSAERSTFDSNDNDDDAAPLARQQYLSDRSWNSNSNHSCSSASRSQSRRRSSSNISSSCNKGRKDGTSSQRKKDNTRKNDLSRRDSPTSSSTTSSSNHSDESHRKKRKSRNLKDLLINESNNSSTSSFHSTTKRNMSIESWNILQNSNKSCSQELGIDATNSLSNDLHKNVDCKCDEFPNLSTLDLIDDEDQEEISQTRSMSKNDATKRVSEESKHEAKKGSKTSRSEMNSETELRKLNSRSTTPSKSESQQTNHTKQDDELHKHTSQTNRSNLDQEGTNSDDTINQRSRSSLGRSERARHTSSSQLDDSRNGSQHSAKKTTIDNITATPSTRQKSSKSRDSQRSLRRGSPKGQPLNSDVDETNDNTLANKSKDSSSHRNDRPSSRRRREKNESAGDRVWKDSAPRSYREKDTKPCESPRNAINLATDNQTLETQHSLDCQNTTVNDEDTTIEIKIEKQQHERKQAMNQLPIDQKNSKQSGRSHSSQKNKDRSKKQRSPKSHRPVLNDEILVTSSPNRCRGREQHSVIHDFQLVSAVHPIVSPVSRCNASSMDSTPVFVGATMNTSGIESTASENVISQQSIDMQCIEQTSDNRSCDESGAHTDIDLLTIGSDTMTTTSSQNTWLEHVQQLQQKQRDKVSVLEPINLKQPPISNDNRDQQVIPESLLASRAKSKFDIDLPRTSQTAVKGAAKGIVRDNLNTQKNLAYDIGNKSNKGYYAQHFQCAKNRKEDLVRHDPQDTQSLVSSDRNGLTPEQLAWAGIDHVLNDTDEQTASICTRDVLPDAVIHALAKFHESASTFQSTSASNNLKSCNEKDPTNLEKLMMKVEETTIPSLADFDDAMTIATTLTSSSLMSFLTMNKNIVSNATDNETDHAALGNFVFGALNNIAQNSKQRNEEDGLEQKDAGSVGSDTLLKQLNITDPQLLVQLLILLCSQLRKATGESALQPAISGLLEALQTENEAQFVANEDNEKSIAMRQDKKEVESCTSNSSMAQSTANKDNENSIAMRQDKRQVESCTSNSSKPPKHTENKAKVCPIQALEEDTSSDSEDLAFLVTPVILNKREDINNRSGSLPSLTSFGTMPTTSLDSHHPDMIVTQSQIQDSEIAFEEVDFAKLSFSTSIPVMGFVSTPFPTALAKAEEVEGRDSGRSKKKKSTSRRSRSRSSSSPKKKTKQKGDEKNRTDERNRQRSPKPKAKQHRLSLKKATKIDLTAIDMTGPEQFESLERNKHIKKDKQRKERSPGKKRNLLGFPSILLASRSSQLSAPLPKSDAKRKQSYNDSTLSVWSLKGLSSLSMFGGKRSASGSILPIGVVGGSVSHSTSAGCNPNGTIGRGDARFFPDDESYCEDGAGNLLD